MQNVCDGSLLTCSQSEPEGAAVLGLERVVTYGENALRRIPDGREGGCGEEEEGSSGQHHVPRVQDHWQAEEDVGEQPAAKRCPVEECAGVSVVATGNGWMSGRAPALMVLPECRRGVTSRVSVLEDESAGAAGGEFLGDVENRAG